MGEVDLKFPSEVGVEAEVVGRFCLVPMGMPRPISRLWAAAIDNRGDVEVVFGAVMVPAVVGPVEFKGGGAVGARG